MTMQNNPTPIYAPTTSYNHMNKNMNMNMNVSNNSNMSRTTLSSPPSTNSYHQNNNNNNTITSTQPQPPQYQPANSRNNSPNSSPKLSSIAEEKTVDDDECYINEHSLNISAPVFTPSPPSSPSLTPSLHQMSTMPQYSAKKLKLFEPKYPARAQLNIFIHKNLT
eukprot:CAMPEP_0201564198 /NCGR_PEP_ID=MMETSP0190_2-20130828/2236_1 /ASSEMBLY_ACC=CAM_ASM_000263 /TAXON_ID=37353 /ORGANISM="Rosalina sp." /LENGTH=164 /DNA_ID=CAMNT_0047980037 /DNA_START=367 /DNA_END=857 /DNA_ORIENTATION=-